MPTQSEAGKKLLTAKELQEKLHISPNTLLRLRKENSIPFIKIGGSFRYDLDKIIAASEKGGATC